LLSFLFLLTNIISPTNPINRTEDDVIKAIIKVCVLELTITVSPSTTNLSDSNAEIDSSIINPDCSANRVGAIEDQTSSPFDNPASWKLVIFLGVPPWLDVYQTNSTYSESFSELSCEVCIEPNLSTPLNDIVIFLNCSSNLNC
jgi:hypothetical protein